MKGGTVQEYKNVGAHAEELTGGRVVGLGEVVDLSAEDVKDEHNKRLIDEGILIETGTPSTGKDKKSTSGQGEGSED